jgi:hypothetical protein
MYLANETATLLCMAQGRGAQVHVAGFVRKEIVMPRRPTTKNAARSARSTSRRPKATKARASSERRPHSSRSAPSRKAKAAGGGRPHAAAAAKAAAGARARTRQRESVTSAKPRRTRGAPSAQHDGTVAVTSPATRVPSQAGSTPPPAEVGTDTRRLIMVLPLRHRRENVVKLDDGWRRHRYGSRQAFVDAAIGYMFELLGEAELAKVFLGPRLLSGAAAAVEAS